MRLWKERHQKWAKTTIARWTPQGSDISYEPIPRPCSTPSRAGTPEEPRRHGRSHAGRKDRREPGQGRGQVVSFRIWRQENAATPGGYEEFRVPYRKGANVISCLMEIQRNPVNAAGQTTTPVTWDAACLEEVCGSCTMIINGRVRMACSALVDKLERPITLEPMRKFPMVRDLAVDREPDVRVAEAGEGLDRARRHPQPRPRTAAEPERAGPALRALHLHDVRLLPGGLSSGHPGQRLHGRGADQPGPPLQPPPHRRDARRRPAARAHGPGGIRTAARPRTASRSAPRRSRSPRPSPR